MGSRRLPVHAVPVGILPTFDESRGHQTGRLSQGRRCQAAPEKLHVPSGHQVHTGIFKCTTTQKSIILLILKFNATLHQ